MPQVIDKASNFVGKSELNLFGLPPTQVATERSSWHVVHPRNTVPETELSTPITFHISGVPDYLDLKRNLLKVKFQIRKSDGTAIAGTNDVAPINYIGNSFIKQLKIFIGNKIVYDSQDTYMFRCYIETMINCSRKVKKTQLRTAGWATDVKPHASTTIDAAENVGYQ